MTLDKPIWVAGCMSGTSLDGVDVALLQTDGRHIYDFGPTHYVPYGAADQTILRRALGQWPGGPDVAEAAKIIEDVHIEALKAVGPCDIIGFHGQTLAHDPGQASTHQAGDGARLAQMLGRPVVWDFR
ncbi:MAG: anhydro-N-acetylmuramic acid kinase, partial [Pseudomonadota bacterium]